MKVSYCNVTIARKLSVIHGKKIVPLTNRLFASMVSDDSSYYNDFYLMDSNNIPTGISHTDIDISPIGEGFYIYRDPKTKKAQLFNHSDKPVLSTWYDDIDWKGERQFTLCTQIHL